jgi:ketosteroid isomerase-like protein
VDRKELRAFLLRRADNWTRKDVDAIMADYADDIVYIAPTVRYHGTAGMRENIVRYLEQHADISVELTRLIVDGDDGNQGALEWTWYETRLADGRRRAYEDAIVFELRDGKISYWREYFDTYGMR